MKRKAQTTSASNNKKAKTATATRKAAVKSAPTKANSAPIAPPTTASSSAGASKSSIPSTPRPFAPLRLPSPLVGKLDLYSTRLPFLQSEYLPKGAKAPNFPAVYDKILFYQAKPDFSLRCALREDAGGGSGGQGRIACAGVVNPISDEPLEPLCILDGQTKESVNFDSSQSAHPSTVGNGWGYEAKIELDDAAEGCGCGMISSAKGSFMLRKVWEAPSDNAKELFEGYWSLRVVYGPTLRRKGFGSGESYNGSFWAVTALKKDGKEVGIDAGDGLSMSTSSYGFIDVGDSLSSEDDAYGFCGGGGSHGFDDSDEDEDDYDCDY